MSTHVCLCAHPHTSMCVCRCACLSTCVCMYFLRLRTWANRCRKDADHHRGDGHRCRRGQPGPHGRRPKPGQGSDGSWRHRYNARAQPLRKQGRYWQQNCTRYKTVIWLYLNFYCNDQTFLLLMLAFQIYFFITHLFFSFKWLVKMYSILKKHN